MLGSDDLVAYGQPGEFGVRETGLEIRIRQDMQFSDMFFHHFPRIRLNNFSRH